MDAVVQPRSRRLLRCRGLAPGETRPLRQALRARRGHQSFGRESSVAAAPSATVALHQLDEDFFESPVTRYLAAVRRRVKGRLG